MLKKLIFTVFFLFIVSNLFAITAGHGKDDFFGNRIQDKTGYLMPVGSMIIYASTTPPVGFLLCDGSAISTTTYSDLFNAIGYTHGGTGANFSLPDMRETYAVGVGTRGSGVTEHDTFTLGEFKDDQMQGHWHKFYDNGSGTEFDVLYGSNSSGGTFGQTVNGNGTPAGDKEIRSPRADGTNGTPRTGKTTRGKAIGMNYIIKY